MRFKFNYFKWKKVKNSSPSGSQQGSLHTVSTRDHQLIQEYLVAKMLSVLIQEHRNL